MGLGNKPKNAFGAIEGCSYSQKVSPITDLFQWLFWRTLSIYDTVEGVQLRNVIAFHLVHKHGRDLL